MPYLNIDSFYTIYLNRRKTPVQGMLIHYGSEWILLKYVPVDYLLDGYMLVRTKYIKKIIREEEEIFNEKVIHSKWTVKDSTISPSSLDDIYNILFYLKNNNLVIQFDFDNEDIAYLGEIERINLKSIRIKSLDSKAEWDGEDSYKLELIRTIQFDNDYIDSLVRYNKKNKNW